VDAGIVALEPGGVCTFPGLCPTIPPKRYQLFVTYEGGHKDPGRILNWAWREMFTQIAFAAELVLDHGWPGDAVLLEVDHLDVAAGDPLTITTRPLLTAEAKMRDTGTTGLAAMMAVFAELNGAGGPTRLPKDTYQNAERKYRSLQRLRPAVFVEVASGVRRAHQLVHLADGRILFGTRATIPTPTELGFDDHRGG
jgi:hypothetical protein